MFKTPRPKKSHLPPQNRKRKTVHSIAEITFDKDARAEYLTGFRKRKQARIKHAQDVAKEKARLEKIEMRKQMREERQQQLENHVQHVNKMLREAQHAGTEAAQGDDPEDEWGGISDQEVPEEPPLDREEEYIDEDRYTTVTIEAVNIDRDGIHKPGGESESDDGQEVDDDPDGEPQGKQAKSTEAAKDARKPQKEWPKKKKKKFRYETKFERQLTERKQRAKRSR
ncbi:hypothetical protein GQ53DRAFT_711860 [Thozetella sp. PMI_491]|nr:hypothetical protein GQ53DRAFT_711860 [Thozetella sp. PMI_491]